MLLRMGVDCHVIDQFEDVDTAMICPHRTSRIGPLKNLLDFKNQISASSGVIFAGGLEGLARDPDALETVQRIARRWHSSTTTLQTLSDPRKLNQMLEDSGVSRFPFCETTDHFQTDFIVKDLTRSGTAQRFSSGQRYSGAQRYPGGQRFDLESRGPHVVAQEAIAGDSIAAIFVAESTGDGDRAVRSIGVSQQLLGLPFSDRSLMWCGSLTGYAFSESQRAQMLSVGRAVGRGAHIEGVFGIDFIVNESGVWPVDINPRVPASAELFGAKVMVEHLAAFDFEKKSTAIRRLAEPRVSFRGKAVVFNLQRRPIVFSRGHFQRLTDKFPFRHLSDLESESIADVPQVGTEIQPGHPILTVFSARSSRGELCERLAQLAVIVRDCETI